jgi:hypothetical protein
MKKANLKTIAFLSSALLIPAYADKVQLQQLPAEVQARIRAQVGTGEINDIDRNVVNGQTVYEVGYKLSGGPQTELKFDQNGNVWGASANASATQLDSRKLSKSELPFQVRRVVNSRLQGMEINDIEREVKNGQVTYGIGYKQAGGAGQQQELVLSDTGSIIRSSAGLTDSTSTAGAYNNNPTYSSSSSATPNNNSALSNRIISYDDVPQNVKKVAAANLNHGDVKRVERHVRNGEIDYTIDFLKDNGQYQQMLISEDGRVLANQLLPGTAVGAPANVQSGTSSSSPSTENNSLLNRVGRALFDQQKPQQ